MMTKDPVDPPIADRGSKRVAARQPQRKPGQVRFRRLLEALDQLLAEKEVQDISLYQIAAQAKVPSASIYHFFPSTEAALMASAHVHHQALLDLSTQRPAGRPAGWQDLFRQKATEAAGYYNAHPAASRLFLAASITLDVSQYHRLVDARLQLLNHYFDVPAFPDRERRLATYFSVVHGIFSLSYSENGFISDDDIAEAHLAGIAYLRCYLPEILVARE